MTLIPIYSLTFTFLTLVHLPYSYSPFWTLVPIYSLAFPVLTPIHLPDSYSPSWLLFTFLTLIPIYSCYLHLPDSYLPNYLTFPPVNIALLFFTHYCQHHSFPFICLYLHASRWDIPTFLANNFLHLQHLLSWNVLIFPLLFWNLFLFPNPYLQTLGQSDTASLFFVISSISNLLHRQLYLTTFRILQPPALSTFSSFNFLPSCFSSPILSTTGSLHL